MLIKTCKKIEMIVFYFVIRKIPEISFRNGPEYEITFLRLDRIFNIFEKMNNKWKQIKDRIYSLKIIFSPG